MINSQDFLLEMTKLIKHFGKELDPRQLADFEDILSEELDSQEFCTACKNAKKQLQPHPSFFPSPQWLIDSVLGTLAQRSAIQLRNLDRLSIVGRQALEATGGAWAIENSESPDKLKKEFLANYLTFAKNASPDDLRMPSEAAKALNPASQDKTTQIFLVTLGDKLGMLRCQCNFEKQRTRTWAEARKYGFTVNQSPHIAENQRITLSPGQNPKEIIQESIEDFEASVRSLTTALAGKKLQPLGF